MIGAILHLVLAASSAAPEPQPVEIFTDWAVACDNGKACEASSLAPEYDLQTGADIRVLRLAGRDAPFKVVVRVQEDNIGRIAVEVDEKRIFAGALDEENALVVSGDEALSAARALARGYKVRILNDSDSPLNGDVFARVSLTGSSATFRYMDVKQGRAGTSEAIVARGRRAYRGIDMELPKITQVKVTAIGKLPGTEELAALASKTGCADKRAVGFVEDRVFPLGVFEGKEQAVALLSCGSGAYNFASTIMVGSRPATGKGDSGGAGDWSFETARFDRIGAYGFDDDAALPTLINAFYDEHSGELVGYAKGRGLGDCGTGENYVWDGAMFRLIERTDMPVCRGVWNWLTTWRANAVPAEDTIAEEARHTGAQGTGAQRTKAMPQPTS